MVNKKQFEKETKRMKEYGELFPSGNHTEYSEDDNLLTDYSFSLVQPTPLRIVDSFVSAESAD